MIYKIDYDFENYYSLHLDGNELFSKMPSYSQRYRVKPRLDSWVTPEAMFFASENYKGEGEKLPDLTIWALGNIVLSPKAYAALNKLLEPSGEFLPLRINNETYYMFNTLFVIPETGIDRSESIEIIDSGAHIGQDKVRFDLSSLDQKIVFKAPTNKLSYSFATQEFVDKCNEFDLQGLKFEKYQ